MKNIITAKKSIFITILAMLAGIFNVQLMAAEDPTVIVLFGDSSTTGFNANFRDRRGEGTTVRGCPTIYLRNILGHEGARVTPETCPTNTYNSPILDANTETRNTIVANWGVGGSSTALGLQRMNSNLNQTKNTYAGKKYIVLIIYGTNDFDFSISESMTKFNIRMMIQTARSAGYTPVIGTTNPRDDRDVSTYNAEIVSGANQEGAPVVDHYARFVAQSGGWRTLVQQEVSQRTGRLVRFHPNDFGYLVTAETWFDQYLKNAIDPEHESTIAPILQLLLE